MYIFEAILLLALDKEEGKISNSIEDSLNAVLAGSVLAELVLQDRITLTEGRVIAQNQHPTDHPVMDSVLYDILDTVKPRKLKYWINTLVYQRVQNEVIQSLVEQGVLERKKKHLELAKPPQSSSNNSMPIKFILTTRLRSIVLNGRVPDISEIVLLTFLSQTKLHRQVFVAGERKKARKRIRALVEKDEQNTLVSTLNEIVAVACIGDD